MLPRSLILLKKKLAKMSEPNKFILRVQCSTYNHAAYIIDALNGFVMQQTNFPFVCTIMDDASTDGAQEVIKGFVEQNFDLQDQAIGFDKDSDYGHITYARHKTNKNCYFVVLYLRENHFRQKKSRGPYITDWVDTKYIALCEGDDFWTDSAKLQKQVDFLETHEDYSLCFHKVDVMSDQEQDKRLFSYLKEGDYGAREIYRSWIVPTCSAMWRYEGKAIESHPSVVFGDIFAWLQLAERGKLYCMGFVGAIYRRHGGSASRGYSVETSIKLYKQYKFFEKRFPDLKDISRRKQEEEGLADIIKAPYFPGIWKYRFLYMFRHRRLFFSSFFIETVFEYTPIRNLLFWKKK